MNDIFTTLSWLLLFWAIAETLGGVLGISLVVWFLWQTFKRKARPK